MLVESPIDAMSLSVLELTNSEKMLYLSTDGGSQIDSKESMVAEDKGGMRTRLYYKNLCTWKTLIPSIKEQEKIASFLDSVALRTSQLRRKRELWETYKKGVMQKIFSQQIRFTQDSGKPFPDW
ncbi:MAG: hypothetical protein AAGM29_22225 [Cyanobacteria bacterium J06588_4]